LAEAAGLYYEWHGPADAPVVILSSGLGGSASYWSPNIAALAGHFRVLAYDHRGTGRSDRALPDNVTMADLGADIVALMDALGIAHAAIVGHAIGGMAGLEAARMAPERVWRVVVINGWANLDPQTERCFETRLALLRRAGVEAFVHAQPLFLFPGEWLSDHDARLREEHGHHLAAWPGDATVEKRIAAAREFDARGWLGDVHLPVLLVSSTDDLLVPWSRSRDLAERLAHAEHASFGWGGHALNVTVPDDFNARVADWLAHGALPVWR
jgi:aminoacrylate hydrolase